MGWSDFEIPQFFIAENSKQCMSVITGFVTNVNFRKLVVIVVSSNKLQKIGLTKFHKICG